jgi:hypothetical protein
MSSVGVATASPPVLGDTVASTSTRAEDNVRKVVKALLAVNEQVKATDLGAHLNIGKTAIYARLRGEKPFTVGEVAVLSEYFRVPVGIFYTGPEALFGNLPESGVGGRAGVAAGDYPSSGVSSRFGDKGLAGGPGTNPWLSLASDPRKDDTVVVSLDRVRARRLAVAS